MREKLDPEPFNIDQRLRVSCYAKEHSIHDYGATSLSYKSLSD
jgi:hypothetical protein